MQEITLDMKNTCAMYNFTYYFGKYMIGTSNHLYMDKLESVSKKIRSILPELQELTFGCELQRYLRGEECGKYYVLDRVPFGTDKVHISSVPFGFMTIEMEKDDITNGGEFKIIGHPISLHYVLKAMKKSSMNEEAILYMDDDRKYISITYDSSDFLWNMEEKDDLRNQPEAVEFLYDLLCKN